ncbi:olfactory receptor class A-like protein 1 isoform X2 [Erpetoichthys calabaricus]|uniref:olfactory receptor class A-like protein 1 isoform X2 n=1 Tax=Erpetoichthys calabaricus TaxID=27687 RepID=UPI00109F98CB|nr:olfactory receptor class A-like protein 1 isoform X2 [Erpetoichthys calabaricus]
MDNRGVIKASSFLILTIISVPANLLVCCAFLHSYLIEAKLLTADIILCHLAFANLMVAFTRSIPQTLAALGYVNFFDDIGCKISLLCFRGFRGLSVSLTCLLCVYQAVAISPATSKLAPLKMKIPQFLLYIILFLYLLYYSTSVSSILYAVSSLFNNTIPPYTMNLDYCFMLYKEYSSYMSVGFGVMARDLVFIVLMIVMSGYILRLLYQHSQKVKKIRSSDHSHKGRRAETKASGAVVTLVVLYVVFFGIDNIIWVYSITILRVAPLISDIRVFFATLYTSVCPIVVITTNPKVQRKLKLVKMKREVQTTGRNTCTM